ncbi:ATP-binding protein [Streptomyces corynorhini]|uniref:ATP-binding protein n=1 Tax=Streptomyces corynorhini TaxID=2282652 RepID=A0A370B241_9ACTN|nr:ATP-binding protein [Streptomyces corynorhini]RDG35888.1 ATP-binding protein [Streptomyces corynorhini]
MHHSLRSDSDSDTVLGNGRTEWACRPELAAEAREATDGFLDGLCPEPSDRTRQNLLLVVSELVTNALRHAGEVTSLRLRADRRSLQIEVRDPSPALPLDRTPDLTGRSGGFGWPMVQRLADGVTVRPASGGGKMILAVLVR